MIQKGKDVFTIWLFSCFQPRNRTKKPMYLHCRFTGIFSTILLIAIGILINCSSNSDIAGTSVIGNPESVSAVIVDTNGIPQKNIPVALVPADYNPVKQNDSVFITSGTTDSAGRVVLRLGTDSIYNVTSTNNTYRYELLRKVIISDSVRNSNNKIVEIGKVQLKDPGIIIVTIDSSSYKTGSFLMIPGTFIKMEIEAPGMYPLKSPAGIVDVKYCNLSKDTIDEKTINSVQVNSSDIVNVNTSITDTEIIADTTTIKDTILIEDTLNMKDTVIKIDTLHSVDTVKTVDPFIHRDSTTITDTVNKNSRILHGTKTINYADSVVTADTIYSDDSITVITTIKRLTGTDIIDTTKKLDTLWLLNTTRNIITTGTINNTQYVDSVQTRATVVKRIIQRTTKRVVTITTIVVSSVPISKTNVSDAVVKKDTLTKTDIKDISDSLIIPDTAISEGRHVDTTIIHGDSLLTKDTSFIYDTLKTIKVSYSIDTTSSKDSTISKDTVKTPAVFPDSIIVPVTYYDFHSDGSNPEFECDLKSGVTVNMVSSVLDSNSKPANGTVINKSKYLSHWFRSWNDNGKGNFLIPDYDPSTFDYLGGVAVNYDTAFKNVIIHDSILFRHNGNGVYSFSSNNFFPLDGKGFGNEGLAHNYSFSMEFSFTARDSANTSMKVSGDDDIWVYTSNKLALDLGGIHESTSGSITFDNSMLNTTKSGYDIKFFKTERHSNSSVLSIEAKLR